MESTVTRGICQRLGLCPRVLSKRRVSLQPRRFYAIPTDSYQPQGDFQAAAPIHFTDDADQFSRRGPRAQFLETYDSKNSSLQRGGRAQSGDNINLNTLRIVPASPSYFTATPKYTDDLLHLSSLLRTYQTLPLLPPGQAPRVAWKTLAQYKSETAEPVRSKGFNALLNLLKRLNYIHTSLLPVEVAKALDRYKRDVQPHLNIPKPIVVDEWGRARAVGRRKESTARVWLVEGDGQCLVNGRSLTEYFGRLHDRESAVWALKATQRLDKYNVWALVEGGGTTGQAEAITLAVGKALMAHEPDLKPAVRRTGCVSRDRRRVERKKPGKLKARKMPAWVKR